MVTPANARERATDGCRGVLGGRPARAGVLDAVRRSDPQAAQCRLGQRLVVDLLPPTINRRALARQKDEFSS
jgi:hypothetical protein